MKPGLRMAKNYAFMRISAKTYVSHHGLPHETSEHKVCGTDSKINDRSSVACGEFVSARKSSMYASQAALDGGEFWAFAFAAKAC